MIRVEQTRFGGPGAPVEEAGNCFAACLASILEVDLDELPDKPHIEGYFELYDDWLAERGLALVCLTHEWEREVLMGYLVAGCESAFYADEVASGGGHAVVVKDGVVVWNPSSRDTRPLEEIQEKLDGFVYILYPINPARGANE